MRFYNGLTHWYNGINPPTQLGKRSISLLHDKFEHFSCTGLIENMDEIDAFA